jgi:hypothetical protein
MRVVDTGSAVAYNKLGRRWLDGCDSHLDVVARLDLAHVGDSFATVLDSDRLRIYALNSVPGSSSLAFSPCYRH